MRSLILGLCASLLISAPSFAADFGGTIKGQVVFAGTPPTPAELNVNKDQNHCLSKGPIHEEKWVVNKENKGVKNVFVWLATSSGGKPPISPQLQAVPKGHVTLDQPCCAFVPHCQGMREGQKLEVKNSAPIAHNVAWAGGRVKNPGSNVILPPGGDKLIDLKADKLPVKIACNIHPWMNGWIRVFDHPYFAVTDENGNFEIKDAPVGSYHLVIWQEDMGFKGGEAGKNGQPITIKKGENVLPKIEIKP